MGEFEAIAALAKIFESFGMAGLAAAAVIYIFWDRRQRDKRDAAERAERAEVSEKDRLMLTNHLSEMINRDSASRIVQAEATTKLADSIGNFQENCVRIQSALQNEVDRLQRDNDR